MPWQGQYFELLGEFVEIGVCSYKSCTHPDCKVGGETISVTQLINKLQRCSSSRMLLGHLNRIHVMRECPHSLKGLQHACTFGQVIKNFATIDYRHQQANLAPLPLCKYLVKPFDARTLDAITNQCVGVHRILFHSDSKRSSHLRRSSKRSSSSGYCAYL